MKLYEIAQQAIAQQDARLAASLMMHLERKHGLNYAGCMEYLQVHGVEPRDMEEMLREV